MTTRFGQPLSALQRPIVHTEKQTDILQLLQTTEERTTNQNDALHRDTVDVQLDDGE
jgi:hypothetical protein